MTLNKAKELLNVQISIGSGYNRNSAKLILAEVFREQNQIAVVQLVCGIDF